MSKIKGLFHRKFLRESGEIFRKILGKHEIITAQQDIITREIRNLFRECHRKIERIFQISGRGQASEVYKASTVGQASEVYKASKVRHAGKLR